MKWELINKTHDIIVLKINGDKIQDVLTYKNGSENIVCHDCFQTFLSAPLQKCGMDTCNKYICGTCSFCTCEPVAMACKDHYLDCHVKTSPCYIKFIKKVTN
jgi:hypothetical protein